MYFCPSIFKAFPALVAAESTRQGGVSPIPYHSLNLGKSTDDDPANILENRRRFCAALGLMPDQMAFSRQVHGDQVRVANSAGTAEGFDAIISRQRGLLLAVSIADCTPILVYDANQKAMAAIHAGWRGTVGSIVSKTLLKMQDLYGTCGEDCFVFIGTCIDECSFEVGAEVAAEFSDDFKRYDPSTGKALIDLKRANEQQCLDFGIPAQQIEKSPYSTVLNNDLYFSHRKEGGITGRMMAVIGLL